MYLSYDISTSTIGEALFNENGKLLRLNYLSLKNKDGVEKEVRFLDKADEFKFYVKEVLKPYLEKLFKDKKIEGIFIEEPLLTSTDPKTAALLNKFNGICSYKLKEEFGLFPEYISVHEARTIFCPELVVYKKNKATLSWPKNIDKKEYIWKKVSEKEKNIEWEYNRKQQLKTENFDMSDAYVVGVSKLFEKGVIKKI